MKHLPDLLTLWYRCPLFHSSVRSSICLSVRPSVNSSVMLKFDIYVKVSILINYKTKQPSYLAWHISLTSWLGRYIDPVTLTYIFRSIDFDTIYVDVPDLLNYKAYNYQTLHIASPRCTDSVVTLTRWPWPGDLDLYFALQWLWHIFAPTFGISSTIRPTTIKPCKVLLLNVLTRQIPWPFDLDLYFGCSDFDIIYFNVPDLLNCKTSSYQTLHSASPRCTDSAGILTRWPWPIFCASVPFTHFTSTFNISSTIRPTTIKPCIVLLLNVQTPQVPWLGDLVLYFALHWLLHLLRHPSIYPQL